MPKVLATLITFTALVSAVANAPGVPFARGEHPLLASVDAVGGMLPVDQGSWLDVALSDAQIQVASWHHTWTDDETGPQNYYKTYYATPGANSNHGRPANYEPQGVLLAYAPQQADVDFSGLNVFGPLFGDRGSARTSGSKRTAPGASSTGSSSTSGDLPAVSSPTVETSSSDESGIDETGTTEPGAPSNDEQPPATHHDIIVSLPGSTDEHLDTPPNEPRTEAQATQVPEPMTMSLLGLGLAGMLTFGRRRSARVTCL